MELLRKNLLPLILGGLGLIFIMIGFIQLVIDSKKNPDLYFEPESEEAAEEKIMIDIQGAVINPGVYELSSNNRFVDALAAAGGMNQDADRDYVSKNMNLSSRVSDGLKIYIPRLGEKVLAEESVSSLNSVINLNTASASDLETLPGIGPVSANKIIDGRPYSSVEDLLNKKVVGAKTYEALKDMVSVN